VYGSQALRIIRENWDKLGINVFAEELYALLSDPNIPLEHSAPITLNQPDGSQEPAIRVRGSDFPSIEIQRDNSIELTIGPDGVELGEDARITPEQDSSPNDSSSSVNFGTVVSGEGATYEVELNNGMTVTVTQQQIAEGEVIPAGTVALEGGSYSMQVPVWLADIEEE
jgi:hypothetical protein